METNEHTDAFPTYNDGALIAGYIEAVTNDTGWADEFAEAIAARGLELPTAE